MPDTPTTPTLPLLPPLATQAEHLVVRTFAGETKDTVAVYPGTKNGLVAAEPSVRFSSSEFLARG